MRKFYFSFVLLLTAFVASAQWTTDVTVNTEVAASNTGDTKTLATSDGKTWVAFFKSVPAPNNYEVRAQLLDRNGVKLLGPEGVLVNNAPHPTFTTVFTAVVDANDNLIVGFANASTNVIYINKLNTSGAQVWTNPVTFTGGLLPELGVLNNGDIIVSYLPTTAGVIKAPMQRLNGATGAAVWATPGSVQTVTATHRSTPGDILPLSNNDYIFVFHNRVSAIGTASTLWAQRYNSDGVAQWPAPIQLTDKTTAYNREYVPVMHNDTLFYGYVGATGLRGDAFLQRVNPNGTLPWGLNGSDFATDNTFYELDMFVTVDTVNNFVWGLSRLTNTSQGNQGAYVQKFNKSTGARMLTDNSKAVYPMLPQPYVVPLAITLFNDNQPLLLLGKYNTASSQFIYAAKVKADGSFVWPGDTIALGIAQKAKLRMSLTRIINNQAVATWVETKGTIPQPYAQPIRKDGTTGPFYVQVKTLNNVPATITTDRGTLQMTATIVPSTVSQQVTWSIVPVTTNPTISATGLVTPSVGGNGTAWAKAVSVVDNTVKDSMLITISGQIVPVLGLKVSVLGNAAPAIEGITSSLQMVATITPANATDPSVTWSIVPVTGKATITPTGLVSPVDDGTVWAKAVSVAYPNIKDSMLINISGQWTNNILSGIKIYPNPATTELHLKLFKNHKQTLMRIVDMSGKVVYSEWLAPNALRTEKVINVASWAPGMYIIRFEAGVIWTSFKIMKLYR